MQAAKKYIVWIVIGVVIVAALAFDFFHIGAKAEQFRQENQDIARQMDEFSRFVSTMKNRVPTPEDLKIGKEFLDSITEEGKNTSALWKQFAAKLDEGIVKGEVVYPADDAAKAGTPVSPKFFADFLRPQYIKAMVDTELALQKEMTPAWSKKIAQSVYATEYRMTREEAEARGNKDAPLVATQEAHLFTPNALIPFRLTEDFERDQQKRWRFWRNYLIFKDVLQRAVVNSVAQVRRDVISFKRPDADFDEVTGKLDTEIDTIKNSERFVENISKIEVRQIAVGDGELPSFDAPAEGKAEENKAGDNKKPGRNNPGQQQGPGRVFYDVFSVKIQLVAQLKVIEALAREIPASKELYYVPLAQTIQRLPDAQTMGPYEMPTGSGAVTPLPNETYAERPATGVNPYLAFEHEPPVQAVLSYQVYRPRLAGGSNPDVEEVDEEMREPNR